jgi:hypothetical protein
MNPDILSGLLFQIHPLETLISNEPSEDLLGIILSETSETLLSEIIKIHPYEHLHLTAMWHSLIFQTLLTCPLPWCTDVVADLAFSSTLDPSEITCSSNRSNGHQLCWSRTTIITSSKFLHWLPRSNWLH